MGTSDLHVKEAVMVTPSHPTPSHALTLSPIDSQIFLRFTIEYLFIYNPSSSPSGLDHNATVARLKAALADALVPYYPFAGRVVRSNAATATRNAELEVVCSGQGALFVHAVSNSHTASDFQRAPKTVTQWRKFLSFYVQDVLQGSPLLVLQLTWLKDGAAALGVGINHCICDGVGSAEFLNTLVKLATGEFGLSSIEPKAVWDRHLLDRQPYSSLHSGRARSVMSTLPVFNRVQDISGFANRFSNELIPTSITFSRKRLEELKKLAHSTSVRRSVVAETTTPSFTCFEVLAAHIWRNWARALSLPSNQVLKLLFSINVRNRVKPSVPAGYYGNAFVLGCAQTKVKDLVEKGLGYASGLVKRAKERVDDEYVRKVIESVTESKSSPDSVGVLILSQWSKLGLEKIDFGMGFPVHVGPICVDRYCLFVPVDEREREEVVKVMLALPTDAVDNYESLVRAPNS